MKFAWSVVALAVTSIGIAAEPRVDLYGDALPPGAVARLGTEQMRVTSGCDTTLLPDGKTIVIATPGRVLHYWDITSGKLRGTKTIGDGPKSADRLTLSSDGKTLAVLAGNSWTFWDVDTNKLLAAWTMPAARRQWPVFWDSELLAILREDDQQVLLWERKTGTHRTIQFPPRQFGPDSTFHAVVSPDRRWLLGPGGHGQKFAIVDLNTGKEVLRRINAYTSTFTPDGKQAVVFDTGMIRFVDLQTGNDAKVLNVSIPSYLSLAVSPDGKKIACCFSDNSVVMDTATGAVLHQFRGRPIWSRWTPDGKALITNDGYRLHVWDTMTWKERFERPGWFDFNPVFAVSPDGRTVASAGWMAQTGSLWDANTGKPLRELPLKGDGRYVRCLTFSSDGRTILANQKGNFHQWFDVATGRALRDLTLEPGRRDPYVLAAHISADGQRASTVERGFFGQGEAMRWTYWDVPERRAIAHHDLNLVVRSAVWLKDGAEGVFALNDGLKRLRASDGGAVWHGPKVVAGVVVGSPDGQFVAAWKNDVPDERVIGVWESLSGAEVASIKVGSASMLALSADNRQLLTASDNSLELWDLLTGTVSLRHMLPDAAGWATPYGLVTALALSPDGRRAITSFQNGCALVWDMTPAPKTGPREASAKELEAWWNDLASADGTKAYAALWRMRETPAAAAFLREHLKPVAPPDEKKVAKLIEQLDDAKFTVRDQANRDLERLGVLTFPALRRVLDGNLSTETRRRVTELLSRSPDAPTPDVLRALRAIQVLSHIATPDARQALATLAGGAPEHIVTRTAKAAAGQ